MATIQISDDTTTVTLTSGDYGVTAWSPRVSRRRSGELGGRGPYADVLEEINVFMQDTTSANFLGNITAIRDLLDQAERWSRGENVDAVKIKYTPTSGGTEYQSPIVAVPDDALVWDEEFALAANITFSIEFSVRFWRAGVWLIASEQQTVSTSTTNNPGIMSATFSTGGNVSLPSPIKAQILDDTITFVSTDIAVLYSYSTDRLELLEGESGTGTNFSSKADSDASGGNVGAYTPSSTSARVITWSSLSLPADARKWACVINCRNLSTSISYTVRYSLLTNAPSYTSRQTIDTSSQDPQLVVLGSSSAPRLAGGISAIQLEIQADSTGGSTNDFEIDTLGLVAVDNGGGGVLIVHSLDKNMTIDHATLLNPSPEVYDGSAKPMSYSGNPYISNLEDTVEFLVLGNAGQYWRIRNTGSPGSIVGLGVTADRRKAYLVPE